MGRLLWVHVLFAAACGRVAFEPRDSAEAALDAPPASDGRADALSACTSAILCDDFETGDLGRWSGALIDGPATAVVASSRVHGGLYALDATVAPASADGGNAAPYYHQDAPITTGVLAVREWLSLASTLQLFNMMLVMHHDGTNQFVAAGGDNDGQWVITDDDGDGPTVDHHSTTPTPPVGTWVCVEMVYTFAGASSHVELYVDDALVLSTAASDSAPAYTDVQVGIGRADLTGMQVFVDDVVIADHRIGCE